MDKVQNEYADELIDSSRISVVIQGLTHYVEGDDNCLFYQCVNSIKKYLPDAEIIVSTWEGQACDESSVDKVIYTKEPDNIIDDYLGNPCNFNKMILSTKVGLDYSKREFVLKFRANLSLKNNKFFYIDDTDNLEKYKKYKFFNKKINVTNMAITTPLSYQHMLFHLSDIVQFGRKQDVMNLWDIDLLSANELKNKFKWYNCLSFPGVIGIRLSNEQFLLVEFLKKNNIKLDIPYCSYISWSYFKISELVLSKNFNVFNWQDAGVVYPERFTDNPYVLNNYMYKANEINNIYIKYDNSFFLVKRFFRLYLNFYFLKFFSRDFKDNFIKSVFVFISPKFFLDSRGFWRKFKGRG